MTSKLILAVALAGFLSFTYYKAFKGGRAAVQAEWTAEKLASSEAYRQREKALTIQTQRNDREYQTKKASNIAAANLASARLRVLEAATYTEPKPDNSSTTSGTYGDPRLDIIAQCARAVVILDEAVKRVASQAEALQQHISEVCLAK